MRTNDENAVLAELLFPNVKDTVADIFKKYPKREIVDGAMVLRFAPSPTGFLHIGTVYAGLVAMKFAKQTNGISILRIEDTDKEREVENGVSMIVNGLREFGIEFDEGMVDEENGAGAYGPYIQSHRLDIYKVFAKDLVSKGLAYPCFLSSEELEAMREEQGKSGTRTGCYGKWAKWRDADMQDIKEMMDQGKKFVIRLYSTGNIENSFTLKDLVKGTVTLRENDMDAVLLKSDGYPTYHFAHPIDDTLMRITHITRGGEWFSSVPLHVELFSKLGFEQLPYAHFSPLIKSEDGRKRKLSKRKDPEAAVAYYVERGYPKEGVLEYLLNIANSNFYDWKMENKELKVDDFRLRFEKFNNAGALFDVVKLNDMCKEYIATLSAKDVYENALEWALMFDSETTNLLKENKEYCIKIFNIEREGDRVRKDIVKFEDIKDQLVIFFDELFEKQQVEEISDRVEKSMQKDILKEYLNIFEINDDLDTWFGKIKELANKLGCKPGDVAMVLRVGITFRTRTPDLYQVIQVLGEQKVRERLENYLNQMV
ncbi:MAG: glutamate--tRNA ligase [Candidatus Dojkabacteria bacterium]